MTEPRDRHLAAVVFTDLVGYTALMQDDETRALEARAAHRRALEAVFPRFNGRLVQFLGDGSLSLFPSSVSAVRAALELQEVMAGQSPLPMRVGIDEGEVAYDAQGVYGPCVNRASRIEGLAAPGTVYVSEKVFGEVENQTDFSATEVGEFELKNVDRPVRVYHIAAPPSRRHPVELRLLGGVSLKREGAPVTGRSAQRRRVAFLALLAAAPHGVLSRDKVVGYLWPDTDPAKARRLLSEALYVIRKSLGEHAIVATGGELRLNSDLVWCDSLVYRQALDEGRLDDAVHVYAGPFLDGFYVDDAIDFHRWVDGVRDRFARDHADALETLALQAEDRGDSSRAVNRWRDLAALDPFDAAVAVRLMESLEAAGRRAEALQFARKHARLLREEFEAEPNPQVEALAERLKHSPVTLELERRTIASSQSALDPRGAGSGQDLAEPPALVTAGTTGRRLVKGLEEARAGRAAALPRRRARWALATLAALLAGFAGLQVLDTRPAGDTRPAEILPVRIAIAPFEGPEHHAVLWPVMSDMLIGRGALTSVSNSLVRSATRTWVSEDPPPPAVADSVFLDLGATHWTHVRVSEVDGEVRFGVDVFQVGRPQSPVFVNSVRAPVGERLAALEELAVSVLIELSHNPAAEILAQNYPTAEAAMAWNEGETAFLDARFGDAIASYQEAVTSDPTFALGYYRLSQSYQWDERYAEAMTAAEDARENRQHANPRTRRHIDGWYRFLVGDADQADEIYTQLLAEDPDDIEALYGQIKTRLIYNPYEGQPRDAARRLVERLVALVPGWGDVRLHQLEFTAKDGDLERFDSILALVGDRSKVGSAWTLSRALIGSGAPSSIPEAASHVTEPEVFAYAIGQLDGFFGRPDLSKALVDHFLSRPEWADSDWQVGALVYSGSLALAQGRWAEGTQTIRRARDRNESWSVEFEALYAGLPDRPDRDSALVQAYAALQDWVPDSSEETMVLFMAVHRNKHEYLRGYLMGLVEVWMDRPDDAENDIRFLASATAATDDGRFARELATSLRGHQAAARGDPEAALRLLNQVDIQPTIPEIVASPFFVRPQDRYLMAQLYAETGELNDAERWYRSLTDAWDFPYVAAGYAGLAEVYQALGQDEAAERYRGLWMERLGLDSDTANRLTGLVQSALDSVGR